MNQANKQLMGDAAKTFLTEKATSLCFISWKFIVTLATEQSRIKKRWI